MKVRSLLTVIILFSLLAWQPADTPIARKEKISPALRASLAAGGRVNVLLHLAPPTPSAHPVGSAAAVSASLRAAAEQTQPALLTELEHRGLKAQPFWIINALAVQAPASQVEELAALPGVEYVSSNAAFRVGGAAADTVTAATDLAAAATDPAAAANGVEWGVNWVGAPQLWARGVTGQGIVYANADTGIQWDHPALKNSYRGWDGSSASHAYNWWDAVRSDLSGNGSNPCGFASPVPCDDNSHGTHTLGTGVGDDGAGNQIGVAPGARWIACRNMDENVGSPSSYLGCLQFFLAPTDLNGLNPNPALHADVISNSYTCTSSEGCGIDQLHVMGPAIQALRDAGIFFVASAGNSGPSCASINQPPALEALAFTVGATGSDHGIASLSSRGPVTADGSGRQKPDLVAPGLGVRSSLPGSSYGTKSGTSMASPHVAGGVALLWSANPALKGDVVQTETILKQTARVSFSTQGCGGDTAATWPNQVYGAGELNLWAAYQSMSSWLRVYLPVVER